MSDDEQVFRPTEEMLSSREFWSGMNAQVVDEFEATGGNPGGPFEGKPMLLLHTIGRTSRAERTNPLNYWVDGERILVQAAKGGYRDHPDWYQNLLTNPAVQLTIGSETFPATASVVSAGEQYEQDWAFIAEQAPIVDVVQGWTERIIPIVAFTRDD